MEVPDQVASARAAPAANEGNKVLSSAGAGAMSAVSLLFAWLAAGTLRRRCGAMDEVEAFSGVLWGLSPLICTYLFCWTVTLSPRAKVAGGATSLLLLAVAADKLIAPVAGAVAIVLATLYSACACGRAVAERRQSAGTERLSAAAVASTPTYQSREEERHERRCVVVGVSFTVLTPMVFVVPFLCLAVSTSPAAAPDPDHGLEVVVFFLVGPFVLVPRLMQLCNVGSPVLDNVGDMHFFAAVIGVVGWLVVTISAGVQFGLIAGALVFWMGELCILGILGYYLAVEAHYKQLMTIERGKPRRAKDASGLLDGRDSEDASSAHIDAAAGICVDRVLPKRFKCTCGSHLAHCVD